MDLKKKIKEKINSALATTYTVAIILRNGWKVYREERKESFKKKDKKKWKQYLYYRWVAALQQHTIFTTKLLEVSNEDSSRRHC